MSKNVLLYGLGCVTGGSLTMAISSLWSKNERAGPVQVGGIEVPEVLSRWGLPGDEHLTVFGESFAASDNWRTRVPNWVIEHLTPDTLKGSATREKSNFTSAPEVPQCFRSTVSDYKQARSYGNYVRGHLVPAADMRGDQDSMNATFILNHNVVPQDGISNEAAWFNVEVLARKVAKKYPNTWVVTGPLWKPNEVSDKGCKQVRYSVVGKNDVAVPTHLFKVILSETESGKQYAASFIVPNSPATDVPSAYKTTLEEVERISGLSLLSKTDRTKLTDLCSVEKCSAKATAFNHSKKGKAADA
eukprot:TRINITY_DN15911_c0_g1_i1.p1 TRINITY_DN15911_c0_g1~~TRINITY_DN15911_c0_g1_i1.p1  ORF type:complete len:315 (+),score=59.89 TRINITY_DN15911_c0_g1_i1:41-946(+)